LGGRLSAEKTTGVAQEIKDIAWKAQWRLCTRYKKLAAAGKNKPQIVTAIARELLGFAWAIAVKTEPQPQPKAA
jgi:transposase